MVTRVNDTVLWIEKILKEEIVTVFFTRKKFITGEVRELN